MHQLGLVVTANTTISDVRQTKIITLDTQDTVEAKVEDNF